MVLDGWLIGFACGAFASRVTKETAFFSTCFLMKSLVTELRVSFPLTLHLKYPYKFAPFRISAITTSN